MILKQRIIFFDGACVLCNKAVDFILRHDKNHSFRFASLQGETAKKMIRNDFMSDSGTFVYYENGRLHTKSDAAILVLIKTRKLFSFTIVFFLIPACIRDFFYSIISKRRYLLFGKYEICRIPSQAEKKFFLP